LAVLALILSILALSLSVYLYMHLRAIKTEIVADDLDSRIIEAFSKDEPIVDIIEELDVAPYDEMAEYVEEKELIDQGIVMPYGE